ncbi:MAG: hypothetical protein ABIC95_03340 [archaeon]
MTYINRIFGSVEGIAEDEILDGELILKKWEEYKDTIPEKKKIIAELPTNFGERKAPLRRLKQLLTLEIIDIRGTKTRADDMVKNFESLEHSTRKKRVERLTVCLSYDESKVVHLYKLLCHLYVGLKTTWHVVEKLEKNRNLRKYGKLVSQLASELTLEDLVLNRMSDVDVFRDLFVALVKREKVIKIMDVNEKRLLRRMQKRMADIFSGAIKTGITLDWTQAVYDQIRIKVQEAYDKGILEGHPDINFHFVNGPAFVSLVRDTIQQGRGKAVSERMIAVFVHIFRDWYKHEIDLL